MASSRPPLRRLAALVHGRVRANQRLLTSSTAERASPSPAEPEAVRMTEGCVRVGLLATVLYVCLTDFHVILLFRNISHGTERLKELHAKEPSAEGKMLRVSVEAGGCSGFQYSFYLDNKKNSEDRIFEKDGVKLVVDDISYDFVKGATVDYEEELIRSAFVVSTNPSAVGGCSCKSSFMVK
ncbi:hypothetical protein ACQ4PT_033571 [Festuca glaucescens]